MSQKIHVIDAVRPGNHPRDQRRDLQVRVHTAFGLQRAGVGDLVADTLTLKSEGGVNARLKVPALVAGMVAGADCIDDMDLLRHGGMGRLFTGCLLYTSDAADDLLCVDLGGRRIIKKKKKNKI